MRYKVLMSYDSIDYKTYKSLEALGLKVPYDPKSPESNVYAYQPEESTVPLGKLKSICEGLHYATFGEGESLIEMSVSEYEVNKHIEKTQTVNLPSIGDNVRYSEYKNLVFSVIDIQGDIATISHSLRNVDLVLDIPLNNLALVEEEVTINYTSNIFPDLDKAIYIDVDSLDEDTGKQFALIVRLKTMYKGYEIIFLNPDEKLQNLLNVLKISSVYGDINNIVLNMGYQDLMYSHNLKFLEYLPNLLVKERGKYYSYINEITLDNLGFKDVKSFKLYNAIKNLHNSKIIDQEINFKSLKTKITQSYDFVMGLYRSYKEDIELELSKVLVADGNLDICKQDGDISIEDLTNEFKKLKLHYYIDNIEYYIYLLKS